MACSAADFGSSSYQCEEPGTDEFLGKSAVAFFFFLRTSKTGLDKGREFNNSRTQKTGQMPGGTKQCFYFMCKLARAHDSRTLHLP